MFKKFLLFVLPGLLLVTTAGFVIWGDTPSPATPEAVAALQSTPDVKITETDAWTVFQPANAAPATGLVFYPGGHVDYRAYAPLLRQIAAKGYLVVLVPMPLNLAVLGTEKAQDVISAYPQIKHWAVGGHSLGGSMAAQFAAEHPDEIKGIVFWASYPAVDLSSLPLQALSISGSNDGLATPSKIDDARKLMPVNASYVVIQGGIHAQFGSYGAQSGDGVAAISAADQWDQTVKATLDLMNRIDN
jgi:acetyl esterase/lipase